MMSISVSKRGGSRPGAGAPRRTDRVQVSFRLPLDLVEWLREQPQPMTTTVEGLLIKYKDFLDGGR
jgi:hypothetical protein